MAGDVDLDGRVDALDLQVSISQLGTDPQALGVMPIADQNADGVVDIVDIELVLNSYGEQTDIYTGLWDGSRLLAVVGGAAGFGSIGTGPVGGAWGEGPGITPISNCWRNSTPPPPDDGPGMVPTLLRGDARANCATCPECDEPVPWDCYECDQAGEIVGGDITATSEQPKPGDTVWFYWDPFSVDGRMEKCKAACGDEGTECAVEMTLGASWVIEKKDPVTGEWDEANPVKSSAEGDQPNITGAVCEEYRFRLFSATVPAIDRCEELGPVEKQKEVKFADFTLCYETTKPAPDGTVKRTRIGIREEVTISTVEGVSVEWTRTFEDGYQNSHSGPSTSLTAGSRAGSIKVEASANGCVREVTFEVVEPEEVRLHHRANRDQHWQGQPSVLMALCVEILPNDVSFEGLTVGEKWLDGFDSVTGFFEVNGGAGQDHPQWTQVVMANNYLPGEADWSGFIISSQMYMDYLSNPNSIEESVAVRAIPWFFEDPLRNDPEVVFDTVVTKKTLLLVGTARAEKDGIEVSFELDDPNTNVPLPSGWESDCDPGTIDREEGCDVP